jgi:hypothetical protein
MANPVSSPVLPMEAVHLTLGPCHTQDTITKLIKRIRVMTLKLLPLEGAVTRPNPALCLL